MLLFSFLQVHRYIASIRDTWYPKTPAVLTRVSTSTNEHFSKISTWTKTWIRNLEEVGIAENAPGLGKRKNRVNTNWKNDCLLLEQARVYLSELKVYRTPANSPLLGARRTHATQPGSCNGSPMRTKKT